MTGEKPCKVCNLSRQKSYGIAVRSLEDLKTKGRETLGMDSKVLVSVLLEEDGTIVEDEAYFMCLPPNTKFMILHSKERWGPAMRAVDGGTAWLGESIEIDELDSAFTGTESWRGLAQQLKQDLSSIILMSEEELQCLVDVSCEELAKELGHRETKVQSLQDTLQRVLDQREEERQSREILQLYLQAAEKESSPTVEAVSQEVDDVIDGMEVDSTKVTAGQSSKFCQRTLMVLKGKTSPETRLSNQDLQRGLQNLSMALSWGAEKTKDLLQACKEELEKRLNKVQAMQSLRNCTQGAEEDGNRPAKCRKKAPFQS
ncbi:DNA fragmentation factor subunit alpha-like isoform X1 [Acipenser oxyrinchus oxyrinchus]|uniref:DNAation factor subunit alpha-like isoform X1 n=1 Tax=Acipenser oxyrinchus oxyrinchus TaxID=40147 RepID=A0AAD8CVU3_ACIOX|nr:DNA fragmentation factor subunit alpha-like isoform X1 [Acipenser oxyrinchus oxyrinchus]KAK1159537.1 DNA fragmentation factor subunit alpha-like isoform X1 [Acipenser oxyrinchus oxyrinchus]